MLKQEKGITLIALIITIIVLLILSLVTIQSLSGSDSAPAKASQASKQETVADQKDAMTVVASSALTDWYAVTYANDTSVTIDKTTYDTIQKYVFAKVKATAKVNASLIKGTKTADATNACEQDTAVTDDYAIKISFDGLSCVGTVDTNGGLTWGAMN